MAGSILLDNSIAPPQQYQPDELSYLGNVQQAGWFWGHHTRKDGRVVYRVVGFRWRWVSTCATYQ